MSGHKVHGLIDVYRVRLSVPMPMILIGIDTESHRLTLDYLCTHRTSFFIPSFGPRAH